jgi:HTH-type transcriptional regulator, competence development regulator
MGKAQSFGQRVRELRLAKNLTQRELAEDVAARLKEEDRRGFDFTYLSKIENDRLPPPSVPAILQLAAVLAADSDELLALAGKVPPDVGDELKRSRGARAFFRSATNLDLSEDDWKKLLEKLKREKEKGS